MILVKLKTIQLLLIIQNNNLENANAILGPFYQSNAETAAQLLSMKKYTGYIATIRYRKPLC
jgi:hypothetical protein